MAKLTRDDKLYEKLKGILQDYDIKYKSSGDIFADLYEKIAYDDLRQEADSLVDLASLSGKELKAELYRIKEESYERRILEIKDKLQQVGFENFQYDYDLEKQRARKTDHKTKYGRISAEVYHNELLRQLSDLPYGSETIKGKLYVKAPDIIANLRKQLSSLTGEDYQVSKTTVKREFITLRESIGKALVEKEGFADDFAAADPHYRYRFLADRWNKAVNKNSSLVAKDFVSRQLSNLQSDVGVLKAYQDLTAQLVQKGVMPVDIKIAENLSVRDKIQEYRRQLGSILNSNLYQVVDIVGTHNPAYLDLVQSQGETSPLYRDTVKELSKELGFSDTKTDNFVKRKVPLSSWQKIADDVRARHFAEKERLFNGDLTSQSEFSEAWKSKGWVRRLVDYREVKKRDGTTVKIPEGVTKFKDSYYRNGIDDGALASARKQEKSRLLGISFEDFNREYQSSGEVRSLFPRIAVTDIYGNPVIHNGKPVTRLDGLTRFNGSWYRDIVDQLKLLNDYSAVVKDSFDEISAAKQKISDIKQNRIDKLDADIKNQEATGHDATRKKELLGELQQRLKDFTERRYDYENIGSFDRRVVAVKAAAEELSVKANIMSFDPAFNFNKVLQGVNKEDRISVLNTAVRDVLRDYSAVESFATRYQQQGFTVPSDLSVMSLERQLSWYRNAGALMSDISSMDRNTFVSWISGQKYGTLSKQLPVGYLQKINGKVFRSVEDADIIADLNRKDEFRRQQETRILTGPAAREKPQQLGAFGNLLNSKVSVDDAALNRVSSLASDFSSEKYAALSDDDKKLFDRNFGKPVKEGNTYYRSIYDMPSDVWKRSEKTAGYDVPRPRNGVAPADFDIRVAEEEAFQKKLTEDLSARTWEPVKVTEPKEPPVPAPTEEPKVVTEEKIVQQEIKSNLQKMLSSTEKAVRRNSIGTMGLLSAMTLFNAVISGPSDEAVAHKRKVEEERRMKMYGY